MMNQTTRDIVLSAGGIFVAMNLAEKYSLPTGKVIDLLNDFINIDGSPIKIPTEVCQEKKTLFSWGCSNLGNYS